MTIMHIDTSARHSESTSRVLSRRFVGRLRQAGLPIEIDHLDLAKTPPAHFGEDQVTAMYLPPADYTPTLRGR